MTLLTESDPSPILNHMVYSQMAVLDRTFGALSDATRRVILSQLAVGDRSIGELASQFDMTLPAVSKHIQVLARAGLADVWKEGRVRRCRISAAPLRDANEWIEHYRQFWEASFDRLAAFLASTSAEDSPWPHAPARREPRSRSRSRAPSTRRGSESSTRGRKRKR
jgi:DNA-binding transcriptional ArsR family regulator